MRTVYKYPIQPNSVRNAAYPIEVETHEGAIPRYVGEQGGQMHLWAEVDTERPLARQTLLLCIGTGFGAIPDGASYMQSVQHGQFVWHLYHPPVDRRS